MKRLCFLLPERREEFVNSLTSYSKLQPRPVGPPETTVVSRTSRGFLSFFPGLPLLRAPPCTYSPVLALQWRVVAP